MKLLIHLLELNCRMTFHDQMKSNVNWKGSFIVRDLSRDLTSPNPQVRDLRLITKAHTSTDGFSDTKFSLALITRERRFQILHMIWYIIFTCLVTDTRYWCVPQWYTVSLRGQAMRAVCSGNAAALSAPLMFPVCGMPGIPSLWAALQTQRPPRQRSI